ncbi:hypothetical protein [Burkholderia cenocepacia]|nr:hypothetical protein [Burkholderia cenocepacia]
MTDETAALGEDSAHGDPLTDDPSRSTLSIALKKLQRTLIG